MSDSKSRVLSPEAMDFAPGLLSIQESPPARLPRAVMYTVSTLFLILLLWAFFGTLNIIASAEGKLVPLSYVKIVQPADAGIVKEILIREGEKVKAGQVLMRMDSQLAEADSKTIGSELTMRAMQLRRIDAELTEKPLRKKRGESVGRFRQVELQFFAHRKSYRDSLEQARDTLIKAQREYDSASEILSKFRDVTPILKQQSEAYANMGKDGYVSQVMVHDKQREYLEKSGDLHAQESTVAGLEAAVNQARKQIDQISSKYRSDLLNERMDVALQYRKLQQDWVKQEHKTELLELKAPQAGIVKDLATHTVGTVVSPGTVLLSIVPEHEQLVAEIMIKNDDVGFVYPQQKVKVKLAPYPFEKYGMLDGNVTRINTDSDSGDAQSIQNTAKNNQQIQPSVYKAIISFDRQFLESDGRQLKLVAGMQVVAEINQGSRTVMQYLFSTVSKTFIESGHER